MVTIDVFGNGSLFREVFNAVATVAGDNSFQTLLNIAVGFGAAWALVQFTSSRNVMVMSRWLIIYVALFCVCLVPKMDVEIIDQTNPGAVYQVDNVPAGLAMVASFTTQLGSGLTNLFDSIFTMPNDLKYSNSGFLMASKMAESSTGFQITDPGFRRDMDSFVQNCVFYDLLIHQYTIKDLETTPNIWQFVSSNASPARAFMLDGQVVTCRTGAQTLTQKWQQAMADAENYYSSRLFNGASQAQAKANLLKLLPVAYDYLGDVSQDATAILKQNMMANAIKSGVQNYASRVSAPAALENFASSKAMLQKRLTNATTGKMAGYWLQVMNNALLAIAFGTFVLVLVAAPTPYGPMVFKYYVLTLVWLALWSPLYAIFNLVMTAHAASASQNLLTGGLTLMSQSGLALVNSDIANEAGFLSMFIPVFAYGLLKGGMAAAFSGLAQAMGSYTMSAVSGAASEASSGNVSVGNFSYENMNAFNESAFHQNLNPTAMAGTTTTQGLSGATYSKTPSGAVVLNTSGAVSTIPMDINWSHSISSQASKASDSYMQAASSAQTSFGHSMTNALRQVESLAHQQSHMESMGDSMGVSDNANVRDAFNNMNGIVDRYAESHGVSHEDAWKHLRSHILEANIGISAGLPKTGIFSFSGGVSGRYNATGQHTYGGNDTSSNNLSHEASLQESFNHDVGTVLSATRGQQFNSTNEQSTRAANDLSASLDSAIQAREDYSANIQQADSYREAASVASSEGTGINQHMQQHFMNWMTQQPAPGGNGPMGYRAAERILVDHPELARGYGERYSAEQTEQIVQSLSTGESEAQVKARFAEMSDQVKSAGDALVGGGAYEKVVSGATGIERPDDTALKQTVDQGLAGSRGVINQGKAGIAQNTKHTKTTVKSDKVKKW